MVDWDELESELRRVSAILQHAMTVQHDREGVLNSVSIAKQILDDQVEKAAKANAFEKLTREMAMREHKANNPDAGDAPA